MEFRVGAFITLMYKDYLNWDLFVPHVLLSFWSIDGGLQMFFSCLLVGFLSFFHELLKPGPTGTASIALTFFGIDEGEATGFNLLGQICWYCLQKYASYLIILIVATFNMFLIGAIVFGYGIGMFYKNTYIQTTMRLESNTSIHL